MNAPVAVIGAGSWGTTFSQILADAGHEVALWGRRSEVCHEINEQHTNSAFTGQLRLSDRIRATDDLRAAVGDASLIVVALPTQSVRQTTEQWREYLQPQATIVSLVKGVEQGSGLRVSQVLAEVTHADADRIVVVGGPNLAREIAQRQPTATVVAGTNVAAADSVAKLIAAPYFRPYSNDDVIGVEFGGAIKNIIALAVGVAEGIGLGDNTKATIITRGLAETTRLATALGGKALTIAGLAGLGDLVATCASPLSRNRTFGVALGRGLGASQAARHAFFTAEGAQSCLPVWQLAQQHHVDMPITEQIVALVQGSSTVAQAAERLLGRPLRAEG